jgi:hypothetical protein
MYPNLYFWLKKICHLATLQRSSWQQQDKQNNDETNFLQQSIFSKSE